MNFQRKSKPFTKPPSQPLTRAIEIPIPLRMRRVSKNFTVKRHLYQLNSTDLKDGYVNCNDPAPYGLGYSVLPDTPQIT